ncbi:hypothetical protein AQUCO_00300837v1 [Aquilegia coerulea]|uniref:DNA polymerase n=1 Tax=Aquilegia coerulea TaxID=218851 RepID=A0A2G5F0S8_AQUCA|nr:hypothetical protein AQUCO_00300837v1 [Aquilegia coerulea]
MENSQSDSNMFSVRIVSIDYYMFSPIPDFDICYSSFQGEKVNEVPVIRIYGSTPAGQKTCLHVHKVLPYLYVPCSKAIQTSEEGDRYTREMSIAIEKALNSKLKSATGSKRQHVHGCSLVRARKFYGYHSSEELFVKIYLYYPHEVARVASLLLEGAVLDRSFQPHESHIPYLLQFLVDYNLYGMGHLHVSKVKFRYPLPDGLIHRAVYQSGICIHVTEKLAHTSANDQITHSGPASPIWTSITVPSGWMWPPPNETDTSPDKVSCLIRRQSTCELEADAIVEEIVNQQFKMYSSLSQTRSDVRMVQSLVPIWQEEYERTGMHEAVAYSEPSKPLPENVLKMLSHGPEYEDALMDMCRVAENQSSSQNTPTEEAERFLQSIRSLVDVGSLCDSREHVDPQCSNEDSFQCSEERNRSGSGSLQGSLSNQDDDAVPSESSHRFVETVAANEEVSSFEKLDKSAPKGIDTEALGLLKWLASSQGAEELTTDDELDYDECQDILDSVVDTKSFVSEDGAVHSTSDNSSTRMASETIIPQVDGSCDDLITGSVGNLSEVDMTIEMGGSSHRALEGEDLGPNNEKRKHSKLWGSLPNSSQTVEMKGSLLSSSSGKKDGKSFDNFMNDANTKNCGLKKQKVLTGSSMRDLMRRKRCRRVEPSEVGTCKVNNPHLGIEEGETSLSPKRLEFDAKNSDKEGVLSKSLLGETLFSDQEATAYERSSSLATCTQVACPKVFGIGLSCSDSPLHGSTSKNEHFISHKRENDMKPFEVSSRTRSIVLEDVSLMHSETEEVPEFILSLKKDTTSDTGKLDGKLTEKFEVSRCLTPFVEKGQKGHTAVNLLSGVCSGGFGSTNADTNTDAPLSENVSIQQNIQTEVGFGVPTHYQNDGSILYLLTTKYSPPSVDCNIHNDWETTSNPPEVRAVLTGDNDILNRNFKAKNNNNEVSKLHCEGTELKRDKCNDNWRDVSQISGPDVRSKLTPLSQIGFRDSASAGDGQQLTLMSIEVQAESRGDLRPDPRFDAITVIALTIQDDNGYSPEAFVLLNLDGISGCKVIISSEEKNLFYHFVKIVRLSDPDIMMGWEIQGGSLGYLAERAAHLEIQMPDDLLPEPLISDPTLFGDGIIEDEWGRTHASGVHVGGRIVLNVWRLMRGEVKLNMYTIEAVAEEVLRRKVPSIPPRILTLWFFSGPGRARFRCIQYVMERAKLNLEIMNQLDMINRTSELARVFGIDFFSVLSRGSQYRVESMLLRLAHTQNYLAISPGNQQVASQPAMECLPLVMEPESRFYSDPVIVLDFQSLYPSMIIAYNLCFCTCLGKVIPAKANTLGVSSYLPDPQFLSSLTKNVLLTPNGVMYVPSNVRKGVLPRLLEEILSTRIMVKRAMKKLTSSQRILHRIFNARQLALKLISNVTYGYTAAGFSGRMPCAELADSIVQCGRRTLENAIAVVNSHDKWNARVIYGDTDSMFVLLKGRTVHEAFRIGQEIASVITGMNPDPVTLKMEKVYHPCFLLTKKRYVGYSYETPDQADPLFDAKGIETVRRDSCGAVAKTLEKSLKLFFEHHDISKVKVYLERQWTRILSGRVSLQDFVFAKEVRLGTYSTRLSSLPPAAIVATKAMKVDPRAEPRYAERIPYVVIHGEPGARLVDMVVDPLDLLTMESPFRLNDSYYINKQIIPALQRVFGLVGADLKHWFVEMPRSYRPALDKRSSYVSSGQRSRIDSYYLSRHCLLCGELVQASNHVCDKCSQKEAAVAIAVSGRTSKLERDIQHLAAICQHCGGGDISVESGIKCVSLACTVFYERRKVQKELQALSDVATKIGLYPRCIVEWF